MTRFAIFLAALLLAVPPACSSDNDALSDLPNEPLPIRFEDGGRAEDIVAILRADVEDRDEANRVAWDAAGGIEISLIYDDAVTVAGAYRLTGSDGAYAVKAGDALGLQYGAYELLERAGIVFLHPEETYFPPSLCLDCVGDVDEEAAPGYTMRGTHVHTMHPIEYESTLLGNDPSTLHRFDRFLGWLIARRQNYLEWNLLRTIDDEAWLAHATEMVKRAHARGFNMGIVAPIAFRQQNSFFLYDAEAPEPATTQMAASVDWLMQAGWDRINVEMGASEFFSVSDTEQVAWLDFLADYLDANYPGTRTATKVHCTVNQTAPSFDDMNFNYIVKYAEGNVGVMPHTVQWYDLYRVGPTYDREDFFDMREFLLGEIGKREVFYYPETAYWVTFDNDVPIFLPQYVYARWNDLHRLRNTGMDGQINFSSGLEWGYWLNDLGAAWHVYAPADDYLAPIRRVLSIFGDRADEAVSLLDEQILWQGDELLEKNGIRWLVAWDAADDIGHFTGIHAQPIRARLYEVDKMTPDAVETFAEEDLTQLAAMIPVLNDYASRWDRLGEGLRTAGARRIHREFGLGIRINALRARYMLALYEGVVARVKGDDVMEAARFAEADAIKGQALKVANTQSDTYRFPYDEIAVDRESYTSYPFGYLRTVPDLWYWEREMQMAAEPGTYDFLHALYDLVGSSGL